METIGYKRVNRQPLEPIVLTRRDKLVAEATEFENLIKSSPAKI